MVAAAAEAAVITSESVNDEQVERRRRSAPLKPGAAGAGFGAARRLLLMRGWCSQHLNMLEPSATNYYYYISHNRERQRCVHVGRITIEPSTCNKFSDALR